MTQPINLQTLKAPRTLAEIADTGKIEALLIDNLKFDHVYQRDLSPDVVQQMAEEWDPRVAGAIVVNRRSNGEEYVVDGQHRTAAAKTVGESHILALVFEDLTPREEAMMRVQGNFRKADNPQDRFRARLAAGDKEAKEIQTIAADFGTRINFVPDSKNGINCVGAVEALYRKDGGVLLSEVFEVIHDAWGTVGGENARVAVIKGIAWLIEHHHKVDINRVISRLQTEGSQGIMRKAKSHQAAHQGSIWLNWYRAVVESYNAKLPESKRLSWVTTGRGGVGQARD